MQMTGTAPVSTSYLPASTPGSGAFPGLGRKVLVIEDDRDLNELLVFSLRRAGLDPVAAHTGQEALHRIERDRPDVALLDVHLGAENGLNILRELRRRRIDVPVLILTGLGAEEDKLRGLECGADDYVTKPFSHREIVARIRVQLRRARAGMGTAPSPTQPLQVGPLWLSPSTHAARLSEHVLGLTPTEFRLLHALMLQAGTVVPTRTLLRQVWGYDDGSTAGGDVVRVAIHRLRRKFDAVASGMGERLLKTVPGVGAILPASDAFSNPT